MKCPKGMDFDQTCVNTLLGEEELIIFGDLYLIFMVTLTLRNVQNSASVHYLLKLWVDFEQTCIDIVLGKGKELITF